MATVGDAQIEYTPSVGLPVTLPLGAPIRFEALDRRKRRFIYQPLDLSVLPDRVTIGSGVMETRALLSFIEEPAGLMVALSEAANNGVAITYYPSASDLGTSYDFTLFHEGSAIELQRDHLFPDSYFQMWEVTVRLRTADDIADLVSA